MHATLEYQNGVIVNYLLTAYSPAAGYRVVFHGTRGKVALETVERAYVRPDWGVSCIRRCPSIRASSCTHNSAELTSSPCRKRRGCIVAATR